MAWRLLRFTALVMCIFTGIGCAFVEGVVNPAQPSAAPAQASPVPPEDGQVEGEAGSETLTPAAESPEGGGQVTAGVYRGHGFSFAVPQGWEVHEGPTPTGPNGWNYYNLNMKILLEVKSPQRIPNISFTVRDLPAGSSLKTEFNGTYTPIADQLRNDETANAFIAGLPALVRRYNRPWGEPWYAFEDTWVEKGGRILMVSCLFRNTRSADDDAGCREALASLQLD